MSTGRRPLALGVLVSGSGTNLQAVLDAVAAGSLDVGVSTPVQIANAVARGIPFVFVAAGALETPRVPAALVCVQRSKRRTSAKRSRGSQPTVSSSGAGGNCST